VEIYQDKALGLPPLTSTLARRMMAKTKVWKALQGVRGQKPADVAALEKAMIRFSWLVLEQTAIKEIDINPLLVAPEGVIAMDARVALYTAEEEKDRCRSAIRPYPIAYDKPFKTKDGATVRFRPVRPEDEPLLVDYHSKVSERSVVSRYMRAFDFNERVAHDRLRRVCFVDYDRELVFVVEQPAAGEPSGGNLGGEPVVPPARHQKGPVDHARGRPVPKPRCGNRIFKTHDFRGPGGRNANPVGRNPPGKQRNPSYLSAAGFPPNRLHGRDRPGSSGLVKTAVPNTVQIGRHPGESRDPVIEIDS
jgi:hypothetical protein